MIICLQRSFFAGIAAHISVVRAAPTAPRKSIINYKYVNAKKRKTCKEKPVKKLWLEDLVVNETMKIVMDDKAIEAIVSMMMDLQERESTNSPLHEQAVAGSE